MKKITNTHRLWLLNVQNSIDMKVPFDYVGITPKRIDILFDMDLIRYADRIKGEWSVYALSDFGTAELEKYKVFREKKLAMLSKEPKDETSVATEDASSNSLD